MQHPQLGQRSGSSPLSLTVREIASLDLCAEAFPRLVGVRVFYFSRASETPPCNGLAVQSPFLEDEVARRRALVSFAFYCIRVRKEIKRLVLGVAGSGARIPGRDGILTPRVPMGKSYAHTTLGVSNSPSLLFSSLAISLCFFSGLLGFGWPMRCCGHGLLQSCGLGTEVFAIQGWVQPITSLFFEWWFCIICRTLGVHCA